MTLYVPFPSVSGRCALEVVVTGFAFVRAAVVAAPGPTVVGGVQ